MLELQLLGTRKRKKKRDLSTIIQEIKELEILRDQEVIGRWDEKELTLFILKEMIMKLRKVDTLFAEELHNDHEHNWWQQRGVFSMIRKVSIIPGVSRVRVYGYFGILVTRKDPISQDGDYDEKGSSDLWDGRLNLYRTEKRRKPELVCWNLRYEKI